MERPNPHPREPRPYAKAALLAALLAFWVANLIHNNLRVDVAVAPATLLTVLYWRSERLVWLWLAAAMIALPAVSFLSVDALRDPANAVYFANHLALLAAATLGVVTAVAGAFVASRGR